MRYSTKTNTLEQSLYRYGLKDILDPNLYRKYSVMMIPKCAFNHRRVPMFRQTDMDHRYHFQRRQQSREPYTVEQIVTLTKCCTGLAAPKASSASVSFPVQRRDKEVVRKCRELGYVS